MAPAAIYLRHTLQGVIVQGVAADSAMDMADGIDGWQERPMQGEMGWWFDDEKTIRVE